MELKCHNAYIFTICKNVEILAKSYGSNYTEKETLTFFILSLFCQCTLVIFY